jgi:hypothetical protein
VRSFHGWFNDSVKLHWSYYTVKSEIACLHYIHTYIQSGTRWLIDSTGQQLKRLKISRQRTATRIQWPKTKIKKPDGSARRTVEIQDVEDNTAVGDGRQQSKCYRPDSSPQRRYFHIPKTLLLVYSACTTIYLTVSTVSHNEPPPLMSDLCT